MPISEEARARRRARIAAHQALNALVHAEQFPTSDLRDDTDDFADEGKIYQMVILPDGVRATLVVYPEGHWERKKAEQSAKGTIPSPMTTWIREQVIASRIPHARVASRPLGIRNPRVRSSRRQHAVARSSSRAGDGGDDAGGSDPDAEPPNPLGDHDSGAEA